MPVPSNSRKKTAYPAQKPASNAAGKPYRAPKSPRGEKPAATAAVPAEKTGPKRKPITKLMVSEPMILMDFLAKYLKDQSRTTIKSLLHNQQITIKKQVIRQFDHQLNVGDEVFVSWSKGWVTLQDPQLKIIYEDKHLIVVDKAAGLLSIATSKEKIRTAYSVLSEYVKRQNAANKIFVVHRLDRETSGLMLFAKNQDIQYAMQNNWKFAVNQRRYVAVVEGRLETGDGSGIGTIKSYLWESKALIVYASQNPEEGQLAITHYRVKQVGASYTLVELDLETGRKNQIRVQMNSIGFPLAGDIKYGGHPCSIKRLALNANILSFTHPATGEKLTFETPIPASFLKMVN